MAIVFVEIDLAKAEERSERLMQIAGIGATTASALVASVGNGHDFLPVADSWLRGLVWCRANTARATTLAEDELNRAHPN